MQEVKKILEEIKLYKKNVLEIERQSGIPSSRIYKWLKGEGNPKAEDSQKLYNWALLHLAKERSWKGQPGSPYQNETPPPAISVEEHMTLLKEYNQNMTGVIKENLSAIQANLKVSQELLLALQTSQAAQHSVMLESLERIEKSKKGVLATEADKRQIELNLALKSKDKNGGNGG